MGLASTQQELSVSDAEIIARIYSGDEGAMALLYDRYSNIVYAVALRVLSDGSAAEDILQDVFMQLWRTPQAFNASRGSLATWLAVLAGMPREQRAALEMAFFEGLTHVEIAGKTGQPLGTVKTRIRSGLLAVRKAFAV